MIKNSEEKQDIESYNVNDRILIDSVEDYDNDFEEEETDEFDNLYDFNFDKDKEDTRRGRLKGEVSLSSPFLDQDDLDFLLLE